MNLLFTSGNMIYWVIYDISENKRRSKVSELCKNFGLRRIQKSAFAGIMTKNVAEMLSIKCKDIIDKNDCVFIIPVCTNCFSNKLIIGYFDEDALREKDFLVVD